MRQQHLSTFSSIHLCILWQFHQHTLDIIHFKHLISYKKIKLVKRINMTEKMNSEKLENLPITWAKWCELSWPSKINKTFESVPLIKRSYIKMSMLVCFPLSKINPLAVNFVITYMEVLIKKHQILYFHSHQIICIWCNRFSSLLWFPIMASIPVLNFTLLSNLTIEVMWQMFS